MKKTTLFAGIAILALVMAVGTCTLFEDGDAGNVSRISYDEFGQKWITLDIFTGGDAPASRSMNIDIAKVAINYYEVMFYDGAGEYYRAAGIKGKVLTIRLPEGFLVSSSAGKAIAFAGYWDKETDDRTLLATAVTKTLNHKVGSLVATDNIPTTAGGVAITTDTYNILFELHPVETGFVTAAGSSFQITNPAATHMAPLVALTTPYSPKRETASVGVYRNFASAGGATSFNGDTGTGKATGVFPNHFILHPGTAHEKKYPYWRLPGHVDGIQGFEATFEYKLGTGHADGIFGVAPADYEFASWAVITDNIDDGVTAVDAVPKTIAEIQGILGSGGGTDTGVTFTIAIDTLPAPVHKGYCLLIPSIPVMAMTDNSDVDNQVWILRNGLFDYEIHDHNDENVITGPPIEDPSLGGALLLCIGQPASTAGKAIQIIFSKIERP